MSVTTMTQGLDKARELLPVITIAKETLDAGVKVDGCATYSEYLAHLGVTVDQVRQWRRRLKKAGDPVTPKAAVAVTPANPLKKARRDKPVTAAKVVTMKLSADMAQIEAESFVRTKREEGLTPQEVLEAFKAEILKHPEWHGNHNRIGKVQSGLRIAVFQAEQRQKRIAEEQLEEKEPKGVTTVTKPLGTVLIEVNIKTEKGYVVWELDQESEYVYVGIRRDSTDSTREKPKNGIAEWRRKVYDVNSTISCEVFIEGADEAAVTEALLIKLRDFMTRLNVWRDGIEQEYRKLVEDHWDTVRVQKEARSRGAKRAAATRRARKGSRGSQILAVIKDANKDGNSSRAMKAGVAAGTLPADIPDHIAPEIKQNIIDFRAGKSHFSALPNTRDGD